MRGRGPGGAGAGEGRGAAFLTAEERDLLVGMCGIYSPSGREKEVGEFLVESLRRRGWRSWLDEAGNVIGETGEGSDHLVFLGHCDTALGRIPVRVVDGRLYGRGSVDAKGSLAAFICAVDRSGRPPARVTFIAAVGEEDSSRGARHIVGRYRPDFCIVGEPSGWAAIALGYKGCLKVDVSIRRPAAHAAGPAVSAPEEAVRFYNALVELCARLNRGRGRSARFARVEPGLREIVSATDGLREEARLRVDLRLPEGCEPGPLQEAIRALLPGAAVRFGAAQPCFRAGKNNTLVRAFLAAIRAHGGRPSFKLKSGTCDMNIVGPAWGCPILAYGPGDSALDHTPEEHLSLEEYGRAIGVLATALTFPGGRVCRPEKVKGKPGECGPEEVEECHGEAKGHPCAEKDEE